MKARYLLLIALMLFPAQTFAEGALGFSLNRALDDQSWGLFGEHAHHAERFDTEFEGSLQAGDAYRGETETAITFDVGNRLGVRLYSHNTFKGHTLSDIGRVNDMGVALAVPTGDMEVAIGIFGRNGNPFAIPTAKDILVGEGFDGDTLPEELATLESGQKGLSIKDGSSVNAAISAEFDVRRFEVETKALLEIAGEGERVHQLLTTLATDGQFPRLGLDWKIVLDIDAQWFDGTIEYETAWLTTLGYRF